MKRAIILFALILTLIILATVQIQDTFAKKIGKKKKSEITKTVDIPVVFNEKTLFNIHVSIFSFSPEDRARLIGERIRKLATDPLIETDSIIAVDSENTSMIAAGDLLIMTVTEEDATAVGKKRSDLATEHAGLIRNAIEEQRKAYSLQAILIGALWSLGLTILLFLFYIFIKRMFLKIHAKLNVWKVDRIPAIKFQSLELLSADRVADILIRMTKWVRILLIFAAFYFYVPLLLTFFPWTRNLSSKIFHYIITPFGIIGNAFVSYLPNLFFLSIIVLVTYYGLKLTKFIFTAVEKEIITFPGFYPDWGRPTYEIVKFLILAFAAVVAFPYLPGSDSPVFKGISIFIGVLLSLGSTSAVANMIAGVILTYMRAFRIGDRIRVSDAVGDVIEKTLLVTRVRTIKNEDITIPNAMILSSHIVNYSALIDKSGLILHTSVTIGYDAPWRRVHELLIAAAQNTEHILKEPAPFVLQTNLDDFYVSYEINAYTDKPSKMAAIYSELHQNIQDSFNAGGVEIMSPHYSSLRDGNQTTIPEENLPKTYVPPAFRIFRVGRARDADVSDSQKK
jgi:small-conductance mechanosensitive channel